MRIVVQLIENYLKQEIPTILITTDNNKYLFNVPSSFQRFTREHRIKMPVGAYYFFTRSNTATITGLTGLLLTMFDRGDSCKTKLYLDEKLFKYMEELRYKMGFKVSPISYCDWNGRLRKGINDFPHIQEMIKREDFADIFNNIEHYINSNIKPENQNDASLNYNYETKVFQNEDLRILPFQISDGEGEYITNYIVQPGPLPGKILAEKLKEFGIKGKAVS